MYQPIIDNSYLGEVKLVNVLSANQKIPFQDIPQLRLVMKSVFTIGIECFTSAQLTTSPNSNPVVPLVTGMVVTFTEVETEKIYQIPCIDLVPGSNSGLIRMFREIQINLPKSYVTILDPTGLTQNQSVLFNFIYRRNRMLKRTAPLKKN